MSHICDGRDLSRASCVSLARRLDTVRAAMTVDDELDDVKRARIWTRLEDRLTEVGPERGSRARILIGVAAAAAVAAAGLFAARTRNDEGHTLAVPVDTIVTSQLGPHTFASLVGPAQLDIVGVPGDTTTIHLRTGKLLVDFISGAGRSLRVDAGSRSRRTSLPRWAVSPASGPRFATRRMISTHSRCSFSSRSQGGLRRCGAARRRARGELRAHDGNPLTDDGRPGPR